MATKRKSDDSSFDWWSHPRRPFKRTFTPYSVRAKSADEVAKRRAAIGIDLVEDPQGSDATPPPVESYEELGELPPWLLDALRDQGRYEPTPIQAQTLPIAIAGQNLIGIAKAGIGRAIAYLLPAVLHIDDQPKLTEDDPGPIALALVPTREVATQVVAEATKLLKHSSRSARHTGGLRAVGVYEGESRKEQVKQLTKEGAHMVVGTPGRLHDMATKDQLSLLRVTYLVLDGADLMMGVEDQIKGLASWVRPERQTSVFSATWPRPLHILAGKLCYAGGEPVRVSVKSTGVAKAKPRSEPSKVASAGTAKAVASATASKPAAPDVVAQNTAADDAEEGDALEAPLEDSEVLNTELDNSELDDATAAGTLVSDGTGDMDPAGGELEDYPWADDAGDE